MPRRKEADPDSLLAPEYDWTPDERRLLAYNPPPLEPLARYARNQCKFLKIVPSLEVRCDPVFDDEGEVVRYEPVKFKDCQVWRNAQGEIVYYYDDAEAQRWIDFIEEKGRHTKAEWRGQPLKLAAWQKWLIREFFGWRCIGEAYRRYKYWFNYIPRKNGKTLLFSIVGIGFLMIDGEPGPEVFEAASAKDQSDTLFEMAREMCGFEGGKDFADEDLMELTVPSKNLIECKFNGGIFRPLPYSPGAFHGKNPSLMIISEYHAHKTDAMKRVGETGQGARKQPAVIIDTTAGEDKNTPCFEELLMARDIRDGVIVMPNYLPVIFEALEDDPWDSLETAKKTNPMFGISLSPRFFEGEIAMAKVRPTAKREYIQLQLNRFVQDVKAAIDFDVWVKGRTKFDFRQFRGSPMFGGFDLASEDDLCALVNVCAPGGLFGDWYVHGHFWCPESSIVAKRNTANYHLWKERGYLVATPGNATDYEYIFNQIKDYNDFLSYKLLYGDRAQANMITTRLRNDEGIPVEFIGQGWISMTEPIKFLQTLVLSGRLKHNNPVLDWMVKHAILYGTDRACRFEKQSPGAKIDGMVALAMALAAGIRYFAGEGDTSGVWVD